MAGANLPRMSLHRQIHHPIELAKIMTVFCAAKKKKQPILLLSNNLGEAATSFSDFVRGPAQI